jgi:uncharacterized protein YjdB
MSIPCQTLTINPNTVTLSILTAIQLISTITPSNATNKTLTYTSGNPNIATVNNTGVVTGISIGDTNIVVKTTDGSNLSVTVQVKVDIACNTLTITPNTINMINLNVIKLVPTITPSNATNKTLTYTSYNPEIATVTNTGIVTGIFPGDTNIVVDTTDGSNISFIVPVTITIGCDSLTIRPSSINMEPGMTKELTSIITPSNATNQELDYTSNNPEIAVFDENGSVIGISAGTTEILVNTTDGSNLFFTIPVTIIVYCKTLIIQPKTVTILVDDTIRLNSAITPSNATNKKLTYTSDNPEIADIDNNGIISGNFPGTTNIIVDTTDGSNISVTIPVTILENYIACKKLIVTPSTINILPGMTVNLVSKIFPTNATNKLLTYVSFYPTIATVTITGTVKGISYGSTDIVVMTSDGTNIVSNVSVNVLKYFIPVTGIVISQVSYNMAINKKLQLVSYVLPQSATFPEIKWSSSNNSIATVDQNGLVTAIKSGKVVLTSKSVYNSKYVASCTINIK